MKTIAAIAFLTTLVTSVATAAAPLTPEDQAFADRFKEISEMGVTLEHHPALDGPWGSPNPDAAPELQQFAFMVGRHECTQYLVGINPKNPKQVLEGDMIWVAYYALDGRAIRDEFYGMVLNGEQTRVYDSFAKEWWVTFATVPGVLSLAPEPRPTRGSFAAVKNEKDQMVMTSPSKDDDDIAFVQTITFYDISNDGFEWKSENIYADKSVETANLSCRKVAGPAH